MDSSQNSEVQKIEWLTQSFVTEWPVLLKILESLNVSSPDSNFIQSQIILEKYQEQANLLDAHIRSIITIVTKKIIEQVDTSTFHRYLTQVTFSNEEIEVIIYLQKCFSLLYILCRVRGYKAILKYFPHEVARLEELELLIRLYSSNGVLLLNESEITKQDSSFSTVTTTGENGQVLHFACQNTFETEPWHTEYVGALWLSVAILAPFNLEVIDSELGSGFIGHRLRIWCQDGILNNFREGSPVLLACVVLLGKLLCRPDMHQETGEFITWALDSLQLPTSSYINEGEPGTLSTSQKTKIIMGLAAVLKAGNRKELLDFSKELEQLIEVIELLLEKGGALQRASVMKLCGRIGIVFLPPKVHKSWHYHKQTSSLLDNLNTATGIITKNTNQESPNEEGDDDEELDEFTSEITEQLIGILLQGVKDLDTKVRWSSARRISYLAARLPKGFADQLIECTLDLFSPLEEDGAWHGACLVLAEMSRKGVLIDKRLSDAIEAVKKAFLYDVKRGSSSRGSNVRDAACYVAWAFARTFNPDTLEPYISQLGECLVIMCLFDREVNCRRAAAAAFQEIVGRQGGVGCKNMPYGIDIITKADYFSLGNRKDSYLKIAAEVAKFDLYLLPLINHLLHYKCFYWDTNIRKLSSQALGQFVSISPEVLLTQAIPFLLDNALNPDVNTKHGAILSIAEIIRELSICKVAVPEDIQIRILKVIQTIEMNRLFRGRGGSMVREAVCHLIENISFARFPLPSSLPSDETEKKPFPRKTKSIKVLIQEMINDHLKHPNEEIQYAAARCIRQFSLKYHAARSPQQCKSLGNIINFYIKHIKTDLVATTRRGYTLALGALSPTVLQLNLENIIDTLIEASCIPEEKDMRDAETRRNALEALMEICEKLQNVENTLTKELYQKIFNCMIDALGDYSVDNRGDVGSWVRETAIICSGKLALLLSRKDEQDSSSDDKWFTEKNGIDLVCGLLKQCVEKIDKLKQLAGSVLAYLLYANDSDLMKRCKADIALRSKQKISKDIHYFVKDPIRKWNAVNVSFIPHREILMETILPEDCITVFNVAYTIYDRLISLMNIELFRFPLLAGICSSVGGLSKPVSIHSTKTLLDYTSNLKSIKEIENFAVDLVKVGELSEKQSYLSIPFLKTLYTLLSNQIFDALVSDEYSFGFDISSLVRRKIRACGDIRKLFEITEVLTGLLPFEGKARNIIFKCFLSLLSHKYPKVRQLASEQLYLGLITYENTLSIRKEKIMEILSETAWEKEELTSIKPKVIEISNYLKQ